jgi:hypothetical protein
MHELCVLLNVSPTCCVFFDKLNADCGFYPTVMGELMSARQSLLWPLVVRGVLMSAHPLLLGATVATGG